MNIYYNICILLVILICNLNEINSKRTKSSLKSIKLKKNKKNLKSNYKKINNNEINILASSSLSNTEILGGNLRTTFTTVDSSGRRLLNYYGLMLAGAIARATAATAVHPLNVIKTTLQTKNGSLPTLDWPTLSRGAGSQFIMSIPHGALNFAVTETIKHTIADLVSNTTLSDKIPTNILNPCMDFASSAVSTFICSVISTPQMVLTDRIMAGVYDNFFSAIYNIAVKDGVMGFYVGWLPALVQKIPSYALTWMFFQQVKSFFYHIMTRSGTTLENTFLGAFAAAGACCVMIPVDTVKTRLVMQTRGAKVYDGMIDCFNKIINEEGVSALYRALPPRLCSVAPMIGIQFAMYELVKRLLLQLPPPKMSRTEAKEWQDKRRKQVLTALKKEIDRRKDRLRGGNIGEWKGKFRPRSTHAGTTTTTTTTTTSSSSSLGNVGSSGSGSIEKLNDSGGSDGGSCIGLQPLVNADTDK